MNGPPPPYRIVVFEDDDANFEKLNRGLASAATEMRAELFRYPGERPWEQVKGSGELPKLVEVHLLLPHPTSLVILDWDLSKYQHPVTSELVRGICEDLAVPICTYRTERGELGRVKRLQRWQANEIAIDSAKPPEVVAEIGASCLRGFVKIEAAFASTPRLSEVVKKLLAPPASAEVQLDQYAWGSAEQFQVADREEQSRFAATALGYWIHNRLLQFPGVLLNPTAAASYLDVGVEAFERPEVRSFFEAALYHGPFAEIGPYWWTAGLDDLCAANSVPEDRAIVTGRTALQRKGIDVPPARCAHGHDGAGYYCIITRKPVCAEHSEQPTAWLPIGAERSRIDISRFQELGAWLAL